MSRKSFTKALFRLRRKEMKARAMLNKTGKLQRPNRSKKLRTDLMSAKRTIQRLEAQKKRVDISDKKFRKEQKILRKLMRR